MIIYASRTGNVRYIVDKLSLPNTEMSPGMKANEPYILLTYTDALGAVPVTVSDFLKDNHALCKGVIASGNTNFGHSLFCYAAEVIRQMYGIPIVRKIDLRGFQPDYDAVISFYKATFSEKG